MNTEKNIKDDIEPKFFANSKREWKDPECPKCGLKLGNKMLFVCPNKFCPCNLN